MRRLTVWRHSASPTVIWGTPVGHLPACRRPTLVAFISYTIIIFFFNTSSSSRWWGISALLALTVTSWLTVSRRCVCTRGVCAAMVTRRPVAVPTRRRLTTTTTRTRRDIVVESSRCWLPTPTHRQTQRPTIYRQMSPTTPPPTAL